MGNSTKSKSITIRLSEEEYDYCMKCSRKKQFYPTSTSRGPKKNVSNFIRNLIKLDQLKNEKSLLNEITLEVKNIVKDEIQDEIQELKNIKNPAVKEKKMTKDNITSEEENKIQKLLDYW